MQCMCGGVFHYAFFTTTFIDLFLCYQFLCKYLHAVRFASINL